MPQGLPYQKPLGTTIEQRESIGRGVVAQTNHSALDAVANLRGKQAKADRAAAALKENRTAAGQAAGRGKRRA